MLSPHSLSVNLMWDVLTGCPWSCSGCHIGKDSAATPPPTTLIKLHHFFRSLREKGYYPGIVTLGPVDSVTAINTFEVLYGLLAKGLINSFERIALPTRMLNRSEELVDCLNRVYPGMQIEFQLVIEVEQFFNDTYLQKMSDNLRWYRSKLGHDVVKAYPIFNLYEYIKAESGPWVDYVGIDARCLEYFGFGVDYAFSFSRRDSVPNEDVRGFFMALKAMFNSHISSVQTGDVHYANGHFTDNAMLTVSQTKNELYLVPTLYEHYVTYADKFRIAEWTAEGVQHAVSTLQAEAIASELMQTGPCGSCSYSGVCLSRLGINLMDKYDINQCPIPTQAFAAMN